jgi:hypothetical protein
MMKFQDFDLTDDCGEYIDIETFSKETSITLLSELFQERIMHFADLGDYDTAHAIWSEFVVDDIDPGSDNFMWHFVDLSYTM